jgi:hypothetical protein
MGRRERGRGRSEGEERVEERGGKGEKNRKSLVSRRNRERRGNSGRGREGGREGNIRRGLTKAEKEKRNEEERRDEKG